MPQDNRGGPEGPNSLMELPRFARISREGQTDDSTTAHALERLGSPRYSDQLMRVKGESHGTS